MTEFGLDSLKTRRKLEVGVKSYDYFSLKAAENAGIGAISRLPFTLKVLLENLLRHEDGRSVTTADIKAIGAWLKQRRSEREISYRPARVLMQDFTGVPAVVDLAAMRGAMAELGGDPRKINPLAPVDLVIDHSVMVDYSGNASAFKMNVAREYERNIERYEFLRWGQDAFANFRVVPPGTGICHQVNLEYLAQTVWTKKDKVNGRTVEVAFPDTLVGTDSHTTMINGLAVLGWGVGGIEAEAAMLGQPVSMLIPEVIGFKLTGTLREGVTASDLVLTITQILRKRGVVEKFVEFYGSGLDVLSLPDRATIANMAPEYGATCGFFPIDEETIAYLKATGRKPGQIALVEAYAKEQGLWRTSRMADPLFTDTLELDMSTVEPCMAGPKRPQDRVTLANVKSEFLNVLAKDYGKEGEEAKRVPVANSNFDIGHGDVLISAITSCTNTSNPGVLVAAGLLARNALEKGLSVKPWVKTSLAPGSKVVTDYLNKAGLTKYLDKLGFNLVGYGCTTCIGNSGPLTEEISAAVREGDLITGSVSSGNRNFEGRINPDTQANYLASPPLVLAYAIAGNLGIDLTSDPLGKGKGGKPVYLKDIWPSDTEITAVIRKCISAKMFRERYSDVFEGDANWRKIKPVAAETFRWDEASTYVQNPPYFAGMKKEPGGFSDISNARILGVFGDSITTDHISPAGSIPLNGPAGKYLIEHNIPPRDFNSYGARRGNHEVMMRGTFANIRIKNEMLPGVEGGFTRHLPDGAQCSIYDAAMQYQQEGVPLVIFAGKEYGTGSSRDWAAKGTNLLGVKAVIAESFERIHRSNLVGMGVLPLQFPEGVTRKTLEITGNETIDIEGMAAGIKPKTAVTLKIMAPGGKTTEISLLCRIDTLDEVEYFRHGGILQYVLRNLVASPQSF